MKHELAVLLHEIPVGTLRTDARDGCEFELLRSYRDLYPRPVLGQWFEDDPARLHYVRSGLPPWFSNLLPEGPLRALIAQQADVHPSREFQLLARLGEDLPGAVRVRGDAASDAVEAGTATEPADDDAVLKFSLAGVQLKFSARRHERGLTIPVNGRGGDWIVKLPDQRFGQVPRNELATMRWAALSGIEVPEHALIPIAQIDGLPPSVRDLPEADAFMLRRFDRPRPGERIHMEDFAQVLGLPPGDKYKHCNYETLANLVLNIAGPEALDAFLRRLVFVIACGNGDAHLKNWSLIYPDRVQAQLSPAYDLVSTLAYMPGDGLALNLSKTKDWYALSGDAFKRLAERLDYSSEAVLASVDAAVAAVMETWGQVERENDYPREVSRAIAGHLRRLPLVRR
jgi:serine/threonine-protein kinase HipA